MQPHASGTAMDDAELRRRRADYHREWTTGTDRFFHPKAESCPWCGGKDIGFRIRLTDTRQCKPGTFDMDECASCGHIFQNPMLTGTGLAYYYRDSYDGLGRDHYGSVAEYSSSAHRRRVRLFDGMPRPGQWLDVGARHGHFCREARKFLPGTKFWALDQSPEIVHGQQRGWVDFAGQTPLTEFAERHAGEFDVVSMIHYLERTASPQSELDAARRLLRDGGAVLIESVNPASRFARLHGRFWYCWMAPQNLHLIPHRNMCRLLTERGFEVVRVQRGPANKPFDNLAALLTALNHHLPAAKSWPWLSRAVRPAERWLRRAVMALASPALGLAFVLDLLLHVPTSRGRGGNTYRIVAVARLRSDSPW
ncbi:class I SAM-dependent methyltransferase [Kibdelosporangium persicum]|uniref:Ubiquinone biosynthesis O-methyltransferase n=1 Tax=Kibdelosporangium persicum TaxID=2698649 RepID=A0ABX2F4V9_9PSEU|nr:class I SAM-dependent methyltransferase [Kibdelosporangium persicum]NRN66383.1 Ubiquinone biosynthesis O-methyltransferase [Kibdelosporangium persicum]